MTRESRLPTGALLHIDAFELPKFDRPGHWALGDRAERHRTRRAGKIKVIGAIDDHTRLAYTEIHSGETADAVSATLSRAAAWMIEQGCGPVQAVMSDNAKCYATSHQFRDTLADLHARHILIPPRPPRWNGKIERFFRTLDVEWAHGRVWPTSTYRDRALSSFMRYYNRRRPHSAASGRAPHHPRSAGPRAEHLERRRGRCRSAAPFVWLAAFLCPDANGPAVTAGPFLCFAST